MRGLDPATGASSALASCAKDIQIYITPQVSEGHGKLYSVGHAAAAVSLF